MAQGDDAVLAEPIMNVAVNGDPASKKVAKIELSPRQRKLLLMTLSIYMFVAGVEYAVILPSAWKYLQSVGATQPVWMSLSVAAYSVAAFIAGPIIGLLGDRWSMRQTLIWSTWLEIIGSLVYWVANDQYVVVEGRFIAGLGGAATALVFGYVGRLTTKKNRASYMQVIMGLRSLGLMVGPTFNLVLVSVDVHFGPFKIDALNGPGIVMAIIWGGCLLLLHLYLVDLPVVQEAPPTVTRSDGRVVTASNKPHWREYASPALLVVIFVQFMVTFAQCAYETWLTPLTQDVFHWTQKQNSIAYTLMATEIIVGVLTMMRLLHRFPERYNIVGGLVSLGGSFLIAWFLPPKTTHDVWKLAIVIVILIGSLLPIYTAPGLQSKLTSERTQNLGQGLRRSAISVGSIAGPFWAALATHPNILYGGLLAFIAISILSMVSVWSLLDPANDDEVELGDREPLLKENPSVN
eukprot:m.485280 g.485280  ORF g.485280 m.485280 type:complete len:463 (+) comp23749_c0_seq1:1826-3214(+)